MAKEKIAKQVNIKNKKASFEYHFIEIFQCGIQLSGTEVKSIRQNNANLSDAYCIVNEGELWIKNMHISKYDEGTYLNHEPLRDRKLLIKKKEIKKIENELKDKGITVIPTRAYINDRGLIKVEVAVAKGKKLFDKREDIKEKDIKRELGRTFK
ncbi:MAG: SsrA-binding protein SmpB [Cytophagales bacterium]